MMPLRSQRPTARRTAANRMAADRVAPYRIAIVGAGFTGSILATHLLRNAEVPTAITLFERSDAIGTGLAYSTANSTHLLNVRAANMSAFPDDPHHFLRWLWAHDEGETVPPSGHGFVSRGRYGAYIQDVLAEARAAAPAHVSLRIVRSEVADLAKHDDGLHLRTTNGVQVTVDTAALCVGHFPPTLPRAATAAVMASGRFIADPWDGAAVAAIDRDAPVLILGTGLTMVDTVLSLLDQGHRGPVTALSRRGLLPLVHRETRPFKSFLCPDVMPRTVLDVLIALKADIRRARAEGLDWRSAFDALRPYHHRIWQFLPPEERRRFLRHARPYWDVHRHRLAPEVAARIEAAREAGLLTVRAGRLDSLTLSGDRLASPILAPIRATIRNRGGATAGTLDVGAVINACGPECDYERIRHPLVRTLLDRGLARPDPLRLGLDVTETGAVIDASGTPSDRLFAVGPVAKAPFWEMTAVPELRSHCAKVAEHLAGRPGAQPLGTLPLGAPPGTLDRRPESR